ncbi:MAG: hypothetical protein NTX36_11790 [Proteobacteria bacterium]|nr:hypothetical protein [Pseudomonadota bacterium]
MIPGIILKKGRLSHELWKNLHNYYNGAGIDSNYAAVKWQHWKDNPDIAAYIAKKDNAVVGWIIYNPRKSTVEEILVKKEWRGEIG